MREDLQGGAAKQEHGRRILVEEPCREAVDAMRAVAHAVPVLIPAEIVAPIVAATRLAPVLIFGTHIEDLLAVRDDPVPLDRVPARSGPDLQAELVVDDPVVLDHVLRAGEEEHAGTVAFQAIAANLRELNVPEQQAVALVPQCFVALDGQVRALHQRQADHVVVAHVAAQRVAVRVHVVDSEALVRGHVLGDEAVFRGRHVDTVARFDDAVLQHGQVRSVEEVDPVPAIGGTQIRSPAHTILDDLGAFGLVNPDSERAVKELVVADDGAGRRLRHEDAGVRAADVVAAVGDAEALYPRAGGLDANRGPAAATVDHAAEAPQNDRLVDDDRAGPGAGRELDHVAAGGRVDRRLDARSVDPDADHRGARRCGRRECGKDGECRGEAGGPEWAHTSSASSFRSASLRLCRLVITSIPSRSWIPMSGGQTTALR